METESNLLQKMKNVFSDNEDKEKIAEEIKRLDAIPTSSSGAGTHTGKSS